MTVATFLSRRERFALVASTNDIARDWLASGVPEVCLAVADEQSAGRGREGRVWLAPRGVGLLLSLGFRPAWLPSTKAWRLAAVTSLAMAAAGEEVAGLRPGAVRLKWPNDLHAESGSNVAKFGGVLGETDGLGTDDPRAIVGLGINVDWRAADFPADLAGQMTSLREAGGDHPIDRAALLESFVERLEASVVALRAGRFDAPQWVARQLTTGRLCWLELPDGTVETIRAVGVDTESGALVVEDPETGNSQRKVYSGEIRHVRLSEPRVASTAGSAAAGGGV